MADLSSTNQHGRKARLAALTGAGLGALATGGVGVALSALTGSVVIALAAVAGVAVALTWWADTRTRAHLALVETLDRAAAGVAEGGRLEPIDTQGLGTLTDVATSYNRVLETLGGMARGVLGIVDRIADLPRRISEALEGIEESSSAQEEAVEETASLLANMNTSIRDVNDRVEKLSRSADESASSILQMGSSVEEVARNAASLHQTVETSTSSVHEMGASIRQVADSAESVQRMAEETASSMIEMDRTVQQVSEHVKEASALTEKVSEGAERGSTAVSATIDDIETIRNRTADATAVLEQLVSRIAEIGEILSVIGEINDETNLLSLNAAIIAAQAGEQGKAFLVVANHVKTLARRTASSTEEIERVIKAVRAESENAVTAMSSGAEAIEQGVTRSRLAGQALDSIRKSSSDANERVAEIARATDEQTRNSRLVAHAAQETSTQVQQITTAIGEQSRAAEQMLKSSEEALEVCRHVHRSTEEQRETGRYITEAISSITEMIRGIQQSTGGHAKASQASSDAVMRLLDNAQKSGQQIPAVKAMVDDLRGNAESIIEQLTRLEQNVSGF